MTLTKTSPLPLLFALFALFSVSGFSALIYESVWSHYLKLILGHAAYAQTLVLVIFMGGMALGAWLAGHYLKSYKNPLLIYAIVEGIVGTFAISFHHVFIQLVDWLYLSLIPSFTDPSAIQILKWLVAGSLIFPQSILLGMTFPLMSAGIIRLYPRKEGATLSMLYFTNSIGAAIGVLVSVFVLIPAVGLPGAVLTAGIINILLAILVWRITKGRDTQPIPGADGDRSLSGLPTLMLSAALLTGMASFVYEIGWIRMLSQVLGSTTQAFELMLSAFIAGLALGSLWIRRRIDQIGNPLRFLGYVQILMGILALLTLPLYNFTFDAMSYLLGSLAKSEGGYQLFNFFSHMIALAVMLPTTFMAGMTLPLLTLIMFKKGHGENAIGKIYATNTVGAIIGVVLAVHFAMPAFGTKGLISLGSFIDISLGVTLLCITYASLKRWEFTLSAGIGGLFFVGILGFIQLDVTKMVSGVYRFRNVHLSKDFEVEYFKDGKTASVSLVRHGDNSLSITTNGKPDATIAPDDAEPNMDEITMVMAAVLPLSFHPDARIIANIGMGSGLTTQGLLTSDRIKRVDTIEIEAKMVEAARGFGNRVAKVFTDPRSRIHIEDAKAFFSKHQTAYDIIVSEPSNPWVSGVASLFTEEFYEHVQRYLKNDGLFVQWLQLYETNAGIVASVFKALSKQFPNYKVFTTDGSNILTIASKDRHLDQIDPWIFEDEGLSSYMGRTGLKTVTDLTVRYTGDRQTLKPLFDSFGSPINSDYFPFLSHQAPKSRYLLEHAGSISQLLNTPVPVIDLLGSERPQRNGSLTLDVNDFYFLLFQENAELMINRFLSSDMGSPTKTNLYDFLYRIDLLKLMLRTCGRGLGADGVYIQETLLILAINTNSYFDRQRLEELWSSVTEHACYNNLSPNTKNWVDLHRAIIARDLGAISENVRKIVVQLTPTRDHVKLNYLFTAGIVSLVAQGDGESAQKLWEKATEFYVGKITIPLYMRLVLSQLQATENNDEFSISTRGDDVADE